MERFQTVSKCASSLATCAKQYGLVEVWRWKNANARECSCFSFSYNTLSRLDMCFVNREVLPIVTDVQYLPRAISDHSPPFYSPVHGPVPMLYIVETEPIMVKGGVF